MKRSKFLTLFLFSSLLTFVSLFSIGGCDVDFGSNSSSSSSSGGSAVESILSGTITDITPTRNLDGIIVQITDRDSGLIFSSTTDTMGIVTITGDFRGNSLLLEFLDENQNQLAVTTITVFPGADIDVGDITITNGIVDFTSPTSITYVGDVTSNDCQNSRGTLTVSKESTDVIVNISTTTLVQRNNDNIQCESLLVGDEVEVRGTLNVANTIDAFSVGA